MGDVPIWRDIERPIRLNYGEARPNNIQRAWTGVNRVPEQKQARYQPKGMPDADSGMLQLGELAAVHPRPCLWRLVRCLMALGRNS